MIQNKTDKILLTPELYHKKTSTCISLDRVSLQELELSQQSANFYYIYGLSIHEISKELFHRPAPDVDKWYQEFNHFEKQNSFRYVSLNSLPIYYRRGSLLHANVYNDSTN